VLRREGSYVWRPDLSGFVIALRLVFELERAPSAAVSPPPFCSR
jgi:hypothetical protein